MNNALALLSSEYIAHFVIYFDSEWDKSLAANHRAAKENGKN